MARVHPTAVVDPRAKLADERRGRPLRRDRRGGRAGRRTSRSVSHVNITGKTSIGARTRVFPFAVLGSEPQVRGFSGRDHGPRHRRGQRHPRVRVDPHRARAKGGGCTRIGDDNLIMNNVHIAHDCQVGSHCELAAFSGIGGHVVIEDHVVLGGMTGVHQFVRIGESVFTGGELDAREGRAALRAGGRRSRAVPGPQHRRARAPGLLPRDDRDAQARHARALPLEAAPRARPGAGGAGVRRTPRRSRAWSDFLRQLRARLHSLAMSERGPGDAGADRRHGEPSRSTSRAPPGGAGAKVVAVAFHRHTDPRIEAAASAVTWLHPGEVGAGRRGVARRRRAGRRDGRQGAQGRAAARARTACGSTRRPPGSSARLRRPRRRRAAPGAVADHLEGRGIRLLDQAALVPELLAGEGPLGRTRPTAGPAGGHRLRLAHRRGRRRPRHRSDGGREGSRGARRRGDRGHRRRHPPRPAGSPRAPAW